MALLAPYHAALTRDASLALPSIVNGLMEDVLDFLKTSLKANAVSQVQFTGTFTYQTSPAETTMKDKALSNGHFLTVSTTLEKPKAYSFRCTYHRHSGESSRIESIGHARELQAELEKHITKLGSKISKGKISGWDGILSLELVCPREVISHTWTINPTS